MSSARIEALLEQVRGLTADEQVALLDAVGELVRPPDADWQASWARECDARLAAYERGDVHAEDFDVVMARLRKEYLDA